MEQYNESLYMFVYMQNTFDLEYRREIVYLFMVFVFLCFFLQYTYKWKDRKWDVVVPIQMPSQNLAHP